MKTFGKYRLLEPLASGGMAEVWRAEFTGPGGFAKEVALKLIRADLAAEPELARLFVQEARLASRLGHANVVQVFEFDEVGGRPYLAMELVRGRTLRQVTDRCRETGRRLGLARSVHVAAEVARGLAYAHRLCEGGVPLGIVHRDVSPQNVLLSFEGEVKLADFGIARALGAAEHTAPGTVKGKLSYMAPEQARGEPVDGRADLFALGVLLWELCAGRRLFARESEAATLQALLAAEPVPPPSEWNEAVPPELDRAVLSALERDRQRRVSGADEMLGVLAALRLRLAQGPEDLDLRPLMQELWPDAAAPAPAAEPTRIRPAPVARAEAELPRPEAAEATTRTLPRSRRGWTRLGLGALVLLAAAGTLAAWKGRGGPPPPIPSVASPQGERSRGTPIPSVASPQGERSRGTPIPSVASPQGERSRGTPTSPATPTVASPEGERNRDPPIPSVASPQGERSRGTLLAAPSGPIGSLPLPPRGSGEGILAVNASPWATVEVDGWRAGDTPREWRLPAGRYRLRAVHPARGGAAARFEVRAGERRTWQPRLSR